MSTLVMDKQSDSTNRMSGCCRDNTEFMLSELLFALQLGPQNCDVEEYLENRQIYAQPSDLLGMLQSIQRMPQKIWRVDENGRVVACDGTLITVPVSVAEAHNIVACHNAWIDLAHCVSSMR